jgi:hypothetical protein
MPTVIPKNRKDTIIEVLDAVAKFYEEHRPEYYHYLLREIPKLRQVSTPGYTNSKGEFTSVRLKVPTEMFLCVQHILPGFGKTMEDIKIMTECWKNLNGAVPMKRSGPSLYIPPEVARRLKLKGHRHADEDKSAKS